MSKLGSAAVGSMMNATVKPCEGPTQNRKPGGVPSRGPHEIHGLRVSSRANAVKRRQGQQR